MTDTIAILGSFATARLRLAPLGAGDAEDLRAVTDDPSITGAISFLPTPFTLEDAQRLIVRNASGVDWFMGVRLADGGTLAGVVGAHLRGGRQIEIGYWIGTAHRGRGYAGEAAAGVIAAAQRCFPSHGIIAECRRDNQTSWRVLAKLGFEPTDAPGQRAGRELLLLSTIP